MAAAPAEADTDNKSGPWNLSLSRISSIPKVATPAANAHKFTMSDAIAADLILVFHHAADVYTPSGYTMNVVYYVGTGGSDTPFYVYGKDENGSTEDDGHGNPRKVSRAIYIAMYSSS